MALGTFTAFIIVVGASIMYFVSDIPIGVALWKSWIFVVDPAAHADEVMTNPWASDKCQK